MAFTQFSKITTSTVAMAAGIVGAGLMMAAPASASVLVEPGILRRNDIIETNVVPADSEVREDASDPTSDTTSSSSQDIVGVASGNSDFSTLVAAIQAANLGEILSGEGPYTVFAPTNEAFNALPAGALDALLMPENRDLLVQLLYNHIAYGDVTSDQLSSGSLATFDGNVDVNVTDNGVMVDGANVVMPDVDTTNGVIHAVDQVLLPTGFDSTLQARISGSSADSSSSSSEMTRTTTLQQTAIDRSVTPTPVTPTPTAAPTPAPEPVRGLW